MNARCRCGNLLTHSFYQMGCIECGAACCPACAVLIESATYCARCAEAILEAPWSSDRLVRDGELA